MPVYLVIIKKTALTLVHQINFLQWLVSLIFVLPTCNATKFHFLCQWAFWVSLDIYFQWFKHHSFEVKHLQSCPFPHIVCGLPVGRCAWNPLGCSSWISLSFCSSVTWLLQYGSWSSYLQYCFSETVQWTIFSFIKLLLKIVSLSCAQPFCLWCTVGLLQPQPQVPGFSQMSFWKNSVDYNVNRLED